MPSTPPRITAPASPQGAAKARLKDLHGKGTRRTPAEAAELLDLLAAQLIDPPPR